LIGRSTDVPCYGSSPLRTGRPSTPWPSSPLVPAARPGPQAQGQGEPGAACARRIYETRDPSGVSQVGSGIGRCLLRACFSAVGLFVIAAVVLWVTGRPQGGPWYYWHVEPMPWKDRLTCAAAVATGVGAMVALVVSYRTQRDAGEGKLAAQFASAAAQLGDQSPAVRIAGVYAVAALADRHSRRRQQCVDVLTGYLRLPYNPQASQTHLIGTTVQRTTGVDEDQAIVTDTSAYRPNARTVLAATGSSDRRSRRRFVPLRVGSGQPARPRRLRAVRALPRMGHRRRGRRCPSHARH